MDEEKLWQSARRAQMSPLRENLGLAATAAGLAALMLLAWLPKPGHPLEMILRAVLLVESFGYAYHRFFQHVGWLTRRSGVIRRNQMFHWIHHMVIYPIGRFYQRSVAYIAAETGLALSWVIPGWIAGLTALATMGLHTGTFVFLGALAAYAKLVIDETHSRFHLQNHSWQGSRYFKWLEEIHVLHHWDQRNNFTIVHPAMDWLFGTYLAPVKHQPELQIAMEDRELTVSDIMNWRYLLKEATPAEHAAFISQAKKHPRSLRKLDLLLALLDRRLDRDPADIEALDLHKRAADLLKIVAAPAAL